LPGIKEKERRKHPGERGRLKFAFEGRGCGAAGGKAAAAPKKTQHQTDILKKQIPRKKGKTSCP